MKYFAALAFVAISACQMTDDAGETAGMRLANADDALVASCRAIGRDALATAD